MWGDGYAPRLLFFCITASISRYGYGIMRTDFEFSSLIHVLHGIGGFILVLFFAMGNWDTHVVRSACVAYVFLLFVEKGYERAT